MLLVPASLVLILETGNPTMEEHLRSIVSYRENILPPGLWLNLFLLHRVEIISVNINASCAFLFSAFVIQKVLVLIACYRWHLTDCNFIHVSLFKFLKLSGNHRRTPMIKLHIVYSIASNGWLAMLTTALCVFSSGASGDLFMLSCLLS